MYPEQSSYPGQDPYSGQPNPAQDPYSGQPQYPQPQQYPQQPYPGQQPQAYPQQPPTQQQPVYQQPPAYPMGDQTPYGSPTPVSPAFGQPVSPAYIAQPVYSAAPAGQAPGGKSRKVLVMAIVNGVLALALIGTAIYVLSTIGGLNGDVRALKDEQTKRAETKASAEAALKAEFDSADLKGKLQKVRDLTTASTQALTSWFANKDTTPIRTVQEAINKCNAAVFEYDSTAAKFPASMLADLPPRISTSEKATNCGRLA